MLLEICKFTIGKLNTREHTCYLLPNLLLPPLSGAPLKYLQCNPLSSNLQTNTLKPSERFYHAVEKLASTFIHESSVGL